MASSTSQRTPEMASAFELLPRIFPFSFALDAESRFTLVGPSLAKAAGALAGQLAGERIRMDRPERRALDLESARASCGQLVILQLLAPPLRLRGQFVMVEERALFLGAPWISSTAELVGAGLALDDFAFHDPIVDQMQLLQTLQLQVSELSSVTRKLKAQREEQRTINRRLQLLFELAGMLEESGPLAPFLERLVRLVGKRLGLDGVAFWLVDDGGALRRDASWVRTGKTIDLELEPGAAWREPRKAVSHGSCVVPLRVGEEPVGALVVARDGELEAPLLAVLEDVAGRLGRDLERRRSREALVRAKDLAEAGSRAKSEFVTNISHEIRTPLNAILGVATLLRDTELDPGARDLIDMLDQSGRLLAGLIDGVLDLSKIEAGRMEIARVDFEPEGVLADVASSLRASAMAKGLTLLLRMEGVPRLVSGDPLRLRQVVTNLAANAIKFTAQGAITILATARPGELVVQVRDTGIGIAPESVGRLFRPFTQADGSITRRYGGTGLGLAISRHLVELMGGTIEVESQPGVGSTFTFTVPSGPALAPAPPVAPGGGVGDVAPTLRGRVLLVEDNAANRLIATRYFEKMGLVVEHACNGEEAITKAETRQHDLILMDCQMPVLDGYEATRRIRAAEPPGVRVPIVALTAHAEESDRALCLEAGMDDYLTKPLSLAVLRAAVGRWLSRA